VVYVTVTGCCIYVVYVLVNVAVCGYVGFVPFTFTVWLHVYATRCTSFHVFTLRLFVGYVYHVCRLDSFTVILVYARYVYLRLHCTLRGYVLCIYGYVWLYRLLVYVGYTLRYGCTFGSVVDCLVPLVTFWNVVYCGPVTLRTVCVCSGLTRAYCAVVTLPSYGLICTFGYLLRRSRCVADLRFTPRRLLWLLFPVRVTHFVTLRRVGCDFVFAHCCVRTRLRFTFTVALPFVTLRVFVGYVFPLRFVTFSLAFTLLRRSLFIYSRCFYAYPCRTFSVCAARGCGTLRCLRTPVWLRCTVSGCVPFHARLHVLHTLYGLPLPVCRYTTFGSGARWFTLPLTTPFAHFAVHVYVRSIYVVLPCHTVVYGLRVVARLVTLRFGLRTLRRFARYAFAFWFFTVALHFAVTYSCCGCVTLRVTAVGCRFPFAVVDCHVTGYGFVPVLVCPLRFCVGFVTRAFSLLLY